MKVTSNFQPALIIREYGSNIRLFTRSDDCVSQFREEGVCVLAKDNSAALAEILADFGPLLDQSDTRLGHHEFSIFPSEGVEAHVRSRVWQPLHMDALYRRDAPDLVVLSCVVPAKRGGANTILNRTDYLKTLMLLSPQQRSALGGKIGYCRKGSVYFRDNPSAMQTNPSFRFSPYPGRLFFSSEDQYQAWSCLANLLNDAAVQFVHLSAGERLVIDNRCVLHGRTAFEGNRHVIRQWYAHI